MISIAVIFQNDSDEPVTLYFAAPFDFGSLLFAEGGAGLGSLGHGPSNPLASSAPPVATASAPPPPEPVVTREQPTPGFHTSASTIKGDSVDSPKGAYGVLGLLGAPADRSYTVVTLSPRGRAEARVEWVAKGYDPAKNYFTKTNKKNAFEGMMAPPPEPLRSGDYDVSVSVPSIRYGTGTWNPPAQKVRVSVTP
jgi:hypothetical protein